MEKKNIIGYGAGGHAGVLIDTLQDNKEFKIIGLIDNIKKKFMALKFLEMIMN